MWPLGWRDVEHLASVHMGFVHVGLGCSIIAGGTTRFPSPTYDVLLQFSGGQAWPYGAMFLVAGFVLGTPSRRAMYIGHWLGMCAFNLFAGLFLIAMIRDPTAAATAWWAYFALGTTHGFQITLMTARSQKQRAQGHAVEDGRSEQ